MREEKDTERSGNIVTFFQFMGWFLICYSMILVMCWLVDTNVGLGLDLTNKFTLGQWEAVKYPEDIPHFDAEDRKYITFSRLMKCWFIIMLMGILLLILDIYDVTLFLIKTFGRFAMGVSEMITGMK